MDYRDKVFLAVAERLNISKAAEELFISQPAVTKHIQELEAKLKIALFERKGNKIHLTSAGRLTHDYLKKIEIEYNSLEFELGKLNNAFKGTLRIGASSSIAQYYIPKVIAAFYKKYPKIKINLINGNSSDIETKLINDEIDLALVENQSSHSDIKYIDFLDDEIIAITSINSVYSKKTIISISDLQQIPLVLREKGSGSLEVIQKALMKNNISFDKLNIVIHLGSTESIKNFLTEFDGISLVSERSIEKELQLGSIKKIKIKRLNIERKFRIAQKRGPDSAVQSLFINFISSIT
jgi:DNA-binding transcriptional LysR family regulator